MPIKVFIDGSSGTTGLRIRERLEGRSDLVLISLDAEKRKDTEARREALNSSDVCFLCLPDSAAVEAVSLIRNPDVIVIDTSTAHRTAEDWTYGFPELSGLRDALRKSKRISNPGCHASGFLSLISPLVEKGILPTDAELSCFSITGYSGGGKKMIAEYESEENKELLSAPRMYGLTQEHKHLPEMKKYAHLKVFPHFSPIVSSFYSGMEVVVPLFRDQLCPGYGIEDIKNLYRVYYTGDFVKYRDSGDDNGFLSSSLLSSYDSMEIGVYGNAERITLVSRFDNLGKGASGAAIRNMNLALGLEEDQGLKLK